MKRVGTPFFNLTKIYKSVLPSCRVSSWKRKKTVVAHTPQTAEAGGKEPCGEETGVSNISNGICILTIKLSNPRDDIIGYRPIEKQMF